MEKISKYWILVLDNECAGALFNTRTHVVYYNHWHRPSLGNLPVNSFQELDTDDFYDKLDKLQQK
jgi:hypothetical protein